MLRQLHSMVLQFDVIFFIQVFVISSIVHVDSAPLIITTDTFKSCQRGVWSGIPSDCCPPKITEAAGPVVDFFPTRNLSKPLRVRKALQCLTGDELRTYKVKLEKGYELMRALPDDDPRSLKMQNTIHCAYGTGAFLQDGSSNLTIDIHLNWFFLPWHRMFLYFHERILQKLLDDPEFTLHFWNFDSVLGHSTNGSSQPDGCYKVGHFLPSLYNDPSTSTFQSNRSSRAFDSSRPVDLTFDLTNYNPASGRPRFQERGSQQTVYLNKEIMHKSMFISNTTGFIGHEYRAGDARIESLQGAGSLELYPHLSLHTYIDGNMFEPQTATSDPIFYPLHANTDRLWEVWRTLGHNHVDPTDSDWLDAGFLFWDENSTLRRIKVSDVLSTEQLGYTYEKVNDVCWMSL